MERKRPSLGSAVLCKYYEPVHHLPGHAKERQEDGHDQEVAGVLANKQAQLEERSIEGFVHT